MRHRVSGRKLARTTSHRLALRRNLVQSLFEHGEIRTTLVRAKEVRAFAEKLITLAIKGTLAARQRVEALLTDRSIIPAEHREDYDQMSDAKRAKALRSRSGRRYRANQPRPGMKFTAESVVHKLFADIGPKMRKRNETFHCRGGYTRIVKLGERRLGDGGPLALLQIVSEEDKPRAKGKERTERKRRARVKYTVYAGKPRPHGRRRAARGGKAETPAAEGATPSAPPAEAPAEE